MNLLRALLRLKLNVIFELKGLRIYWMQIISSLFVMPVALLFIQLMASNAGSQTLAYGLSGFVAATLAGSLIGVLSLRVCNMMLPEVLELYTTFSLSKVEMVAGMSVTYCLLSLPQIIIAAAVTAIFIPIPNPVLYFLAILFSMLVLSLLSSGLGLLVRNYYQAMGLFPLLSFVLVLLSPAYIQPSGSPVFNAVMLLNPVTHLLNLIRSGLGFTPTVDMLWSWLYLAVLILATLWIERRRLRDFYILEKF
jgi:ABC-2 type transport system permease protein